jgi:DNA-directed RNA polymerase subunit N (RpoN/RPB10)
MEELLPPEPELVPVRCVTCNKILGNKYNKYEEFLHEGYSIEESLNKLGLVRPCCRLRLRNPFKVVGEKFEDFEKLSVADDPKSATTGALSAMNSSVIIEEETEIQLKPVRALPTFPKKKEGEVSRIFKAW